MGKEICLNQKSNQQVVGSTPSGSSTDLKKLFMEGVLL